MITILENDPRVAIYRTMRNRVGEDGQQFIADGQKVVERLLESDLEVIGIFGLKKYIHLFQNQIRNKGIDSNQIFVADKKVMQEIIGFQIHQGVMALAQKPVGKKELELGSQVIVLNRVLSAENVGSIIRSATAFGVFSILTDVQSCHPYIRRSVRVSVGSVFRCAISVSQNLPVSLCALRDSGYKIIGSSSNQHDPKIMQSAHHYEFPKKFALVLGNEGYGIEAEVLNVCDDLLQIPIHKDVSSLNVGSAATALLYQASK